MTYPLTSVATLVVKTGFETQLQQALREVQDPIPAEAACIQYDFHPDAEQTGTVHIMEQGRDEAALPMYEGTAHFQAALPAIERTADRFSVTKNVSRLLRDSE
jgi:quinol monooxygenase YgiN